MPPTILNRWLKPRTSNYFIFFVQLFFISTVILAVKLITFLSVLTATKHAGLINFTASSTIKIPQYPAEPNVLRQNLSGIPPTVHNNCPVHNVRCINNSNFPPQPHMWFFSTMKYAVWAIKLHSYRQAKKKLLRAKKITFYPYNPTGDLSLFGPKKLLRSKKITYFYP